MISLITGLPGNGKTLYAVTWLKERGEKENRPIFYSGIKDCMIPGWVEADPERWMELPKGAIIVIDEVQRVMRPRQHGTKVPEFVAALETHRHLGVDLVLITQHPMLLDSNVRRLVGEHKHVVRKFGKPAATIHQWAGVKEGCDKNREGSIQSHWLYPKESYSLYKSAELHTKHGSVPLKVWILLALPFVIAGLVWVAYERLMNKKTGPVTNAFTGAVAGATSSTAPGAPGAKLTRAAYIDQYVPRVQGLLYTAPVYDDVTKVTVAPYPAACVEVTSGERQGDCRCFTQQGTKLPTETSICHDIAAGGFFIPWAVPSPPPAPAPAPAQTVAQASNVGPVGFVSSPRSEAPSASILQPPSTDGLPPGRGPALPRPK